MNTVLSLIILVRQNSLQKDNHYIIADYLIRNINSIEDKSIQEIADACYVSTNTILRFCSLLGFHTYKKFKNTLTSTLKIRRIQLKEKNENMHVDQILEHIAMFYETFDQSQWKETLGHIVDEISKYKIIHLYGAVFPLALSQSFIEDMALLGVEVDVHQSGYDEVSLPLDDGIHIIVSYSGRFLEVKRNLYKDILSMKKPTVLISKMRENIGNINYHLDLTGIINNHYEDIILMFIFDYLLIAYDYRIHHI